MNKIVEQQLIRLMTVIVILIMWFFFIIYAQITFIGTTTVNEMIMPAIVTAIITGFALTVVMVNLKDFIDVEVKYAKKN